MHRSSDRVSDRFLDDTAGDPDDERAAAKVSCFLVGLLVFWMAPADEMRELWDVALGMSVGLWRDPDEEDADTEISGFLGGLLVFWIAPADGWRVF